MKTIKKNFKGSATYWKLKAVFEKCQNFKQLVGAKNMLLRFEGTKEEREALNELSAEMDSNLNPHIGKESNLDKHEGELQEEQVKMWNK